ncbi:hypothetical protein CERZMDRAFT_102383 [Cercospora zeae-maydis SCOH1-5]|uniref:RNA polymerase I-specific transcription initiation factor RRN6-like protein n=1 Tax=Cercospora zeae-maydis SCOH1-5 TaxID=717836 RepID=A0A6A6F174_9PEZI|nr:hypothetical protein CERZMDRAFT_102383 [Cercospora zeae-maydis SCOH1-5]
MAEKAKRNLPYGHYGRVSYSLEDEEWSFERVLALPQVVRVCGAQNQVYQPCHREHSPPRSVRTGPQPQGHRRRRQMKHLLEHIPELQPAAGLLHDLLRVSEAAQEAGQKHDSTAGSFIATSSIRSKIQHKAIRIAAVACGEGRTELRLIHIQNRKRGLSSDHRHWIGVPTLYGEQTVCKEFGGPIRQVVFAEPVDRGEPLLGVRLLTKTLIFRPTHGTTRNLEPEASSDIQPNLMHEVHMESTGNVAHADVAFNPWFSQQLAIVDQAGSWTVVEFQSRKLSSIARTWTGTVAGSSLSDKWARIAWLFNLETIAVCTRDTVTLFSIAGQSSAPLQSIKPDIANGAPWILDFALLPGHLDKFALLTTNNLLLYRVRSSGLHGTRVDNVAIVEHFHDPEAIDLRMNIWCHHERINVLLFPHTGGVALLYGLDTSEEEALRLIDPIEVHLKKHGALLTIADLHITPVSSGTSGTAFDDDHTEFLVATVVLSDDTITEEILCRSRINTEEQIYVTTRETKLNATGAVVKQTGFTGANGSTSIAEGEHGRVPPVSRRSRRSVPRRKPEDKGIDLSHIAHEVTVRHESTSVAQIMREARFAFQTEEGTILPMRPLDSFQHIDSHSIDDEGLGESLDEVQRLFSIDVRDAPAQAFGAEDHFHISPVMPEVPANLPPELHAHSLPETYHAIMSCWLAGLADVIPGRVRLAKAAVARQVTIQLALASRIAHAGNRVSQPLAHDMEEQHCRTETLSKMPITALLHARNEDSAEPMELAESSQFSTLPTPSPTATPSVITMSTGLSSLAAPEIYRLCRYTTFSKPSPSVLSRPMSRVLSHWTIGESPAEYDWQSVSKHVQRDEEGEDDIEDMSERDRKRLQRRAERHIKRQRREAAASQAQQMASSQAPEILTASQPAVVARDSQPSITSSQPTAARIAAASQVVPGRFGGRPVKKKRKSGF